MSSDVNSASWSFQSSEKFLKWARDVSLIKIGPLTGPLEGKQEWAYKDGHIFRSHWGKKGGARKMQTNLGWMYATGRGKLEHSTDLAMVQDIDARGGVTITIHFASAEQGRS
jgi:hypothetical protein